MKTIKTIDVNAKEWFDKVNGNSYFSGSVTINYGMKSAKTFEMPFQYGYSDQYIHQAFTTLNDNKALTRTNWSSPLWRYCKENNIILRTNIQIGCKKKEIV